MPKNDNPLTSRNIPEAPILTDQTDQEKLKDDLKEVGIDTDEIERADEVPQEKWLTEQKSIVQQDSNTLQKGKTPKSSPTQQRSKTTKPSETVKQSNTQQEGKEAKQQKTALNSNTQKESKTAENLKTDLQKEGKTGKHREPIYTIKKTVYMTQEHDDKLYELMDAFKKRTGVKLKDQEIIRRCIETATINSLMP
jgi:hypothetical protein